MPAKPRVREGIFYLCRFAEGRGARWDLFVHTVDGPCELSHAEWWPELLRGLRSQHRILQALSASSFQALLNTPYAFPRGRLVTLENRSVVYWGGEDEVRARRKRIQTALRPVGRCTWQIDEHERTLEEDRLIAARVLGTYP